MASSLPGPFARQGSSQTGLFARESSFTCAVTTLGGVKCWGRNVDGQLGDGTTTNSNSPVDVNGLASGVAAVDTGNGFTCALTTGGDVKCWGRNNFGQLGDGTTTNRITPGDVNGLTADITAVSAGEGHACALTGGAGIKCWGLNTSGQIGDGTFLNRTTAVDVSGLTTGVAVVSAGNEYSCGVSTVGGTKCWGGQLVRSARGRDLYGQPNARRRERAQQRSGCRFYESVCPHLCSDHGRRRQVLGLQRPRPAWGWYNCN